MWDLIVSVPDHFLSFYFPKNSLLQKFFSVSARLFETCNRILCYLPIRHVRSSLS